MEKERRMPCGGANCDGFREAHSETRGGHEGDREGALRSRVDDFLWETSCKFHQFNICGLNGGNCFEKESHPKPCLEAPNACHRAV